MVVEREREVEKCRTNLKKGFRDNPFSVLSATQTNAPLTQFRSLVFFFFVLSCLTNTFTVSTVLRKRKKKLKTFRQRASAMNWQILLRWSSMLIFLYCEVSTSDHLSSPPLFFSRDCSTRTEQTCSSTLQDLSTNYSSNNFAAPFFDGQV